MRFEIISPFPEEHLPLMCSWVQGFKKQMVDDASPADAETIKEFYASGRSQSFAVMVDGKPVGCVWGEELYDAVYLGHLVFDPTAISALDKADAAREAVRGLFSIGARKITWHVFADNSVFRNFLRKRIGAQVEGTLRQATRRDGELVDVTLMASFPEDLRATND